MLSYAAYAVNDWGGFQRFETLVIRRVSVLVWGATCWTACGGTTQSIAEPDALVLVDERGRECEVVCPETESCHCRGTDPLRIDCSDGEEVRVMTMGPSPSPLPLLLCDVCHTTFDCSPVRCIEDVDCRAGLSNTVCSENHCVVLD